MDSDEIDRERRADEKRWARSKSGNPELIAERNAIKALLRKVFEYGDESDLAAAMLEFGIMQMWRELRQQWQ